MKAPKPPVAKKIPHAFEHHGQNIKDDYAWLKDPNYPKVEDPEILDYLGAENAYFEDVMRPHRKLIQTLFEELKGRQPEEDSSVPFEKNGFFYQWRYHQEAQYRTWYRSPISDPEAWSVLLDERDLAKGSDYFTLGGLAVSDDARLMTYSIDRNGGERFDLFTVDIGSGEQISAPIENTLGEAVWNRQGTGFAYVILNDNWRPFKILFRDLTSEQPDKAIYEEPDESFFLGIDRSQSESFTFISSGDHVTSQSFLLSSDDLLASPSAMTKRTPGHEYYVDHDGHQFVIRSNLRQANFDVFVCQTQTTDVRDWRIVVEGSKDYYITDHLCLSECLVVTGRQAGLDQISIYDKTITKGHNIEFPDASYSADLGNNPNFHSNFIRLEYSSMISPHRCMDYDLQARSLTTKKTQKIPSGYDENEFLAERIQAEARDGSLIPISLVYHKDTKLDKETPLHLYSYGAYGHAIAPAFSSNRLSLLGRGFVCAIAHIRGGDDLGYHWYTQGKLLERHNTFNDFVDCARHLINENYSSSGRLFISGGSAGGELMGAVSNQSPELWGAVAAHVPFVDVLNTMLNADLPLTPIEWPEWGNPIEDPAAFANILSYSPYDQVEAKDYPPIFATAGLNDPRVTYWEPAKWIARLRSLKTDDNTMLLKTNMETGHGGKSGRYDSLIELAEEQAFFLIELDKITRSTV